MSTRVILIAVLEPRQPCRRTHVTSVNDTGEKDPHDELERLSKASQHLQSGAYPNDILSRVSVIDQNVNGIGCKV